MIFCAVDNLAQFSQNSNIFFLFFSYVHFYGKLVAGEYDQKINLGINALQWYTLYLKKLKVSKYNYMTFIYFHMRILYGNIKGT